MTKHTVNVTQKREERLPDWSAQYATIIGRMRAAGLFDNIAASLRVPRAGGYSDVDVVIFLLCFLCSRIDSQKEFGQRSAPYRTQLAALANRKRLPSPSSISRYCTRAEVCYVQPFVDELLLSRADGALFQDERVAYRDSCGQKLQVFDWDPSVVVLRKRGLPESEELPAPRRHGERAEAGYPGRKRGEVQFARSIIEHVGSAQPVGLMLQPGNGRRNEFIEHAVETVRQAAGRANFAPQFTLLRTDGVGGNVPFIAECNQAGLRYLSRFSRYGMLENPQVQRHLARGIWVPVDDSGSGPSREALNLGWVRVHPHRRTKKDNDDSYDPVRVRVVISRFRPTGEKSSTGSGVSVDGWHMEMYCTNLCPRRWPAADLVTLYHGRAGCENHYAQMDREQGINRLFSYQPGGQLLATALALWLFAEHAERAYELEKSKDPKAAQISRVLMPSALQKEPESVHNDYYLRTTDVITDQDVTCDGEPLLNDEQIAEVLDRLDGPWRWAPSIQGFICPSQMALTPRKIRDSSVIFCPTRTACRDCAFRGSGDRGEPICTVSQKSDFRKEVRVLLTEEQLETIDLEALKELRPPPQNRLKIEPITDKPGPLHTVPPDLFPARYRKRFRTLCQDVEVEVKITPLEDDIPPQRSIAERRQRRRLSWKQRHLRGELRGATVSLTMRGDAKLKGLFLTGCSEGDDRYHLEMTS